MLRFYIQGSAAKPYLVTFEGKGQDLAAFCSCPAGRKGGMFCKHVAALLKGDASKLAEGSDDIALLTGRSAGSPLIAKAQGHVPYGKQKIQPLEHVDSITDISALIQPLLSNTGLWTEYSTEEDGSEFLAVYMRKTYKNGNLYKSPTKLLSISYKPILYHLVCDDDADDIQKRPYGERALPYLVDSTNYGTIGTAGASFMKKLADIVKTVY